MPSQWSTLTSQAVSVDHVDGVVPAQAWLPIRCCITQPKKIGLLPVQDVAHACWEAIRLMVVDFPHA